MFFSFIFHFSVHFHSLWFFKQIFICNALVYVHMRIPHIRSHDFNGLYCAKFLKVSNRCIADVTNEPSLIGSISNCIHYKWMKWVRCHPLPSSLAKCIHTLTSVYACTHSSMADAIMLLLLTMFNTIICIRLRRVFFLEKEEGVDELILKLFSLFSPFYVEITVIFYINVSYFPNIAFNF